MQSLDYKFAAIKRKSKVRFCYWDLMNSKRCAACKHLRRRCPSDCIFAPYFPSNNPHRFAHVHKIYGASNVGKLLEDLPVGYRAQAAETLCYEAYCRIEDPVYGCAGMVSVLHQQLSVAECQLARVKAEVAAIRKESSNANVAELPTWFE